MSECIYPQNAPRTAYNKGCRCLRCKAANTKEMQQYRSKYREKYNKMMQKWREKNREKDRFFSRRWGKNNRPKKNAHKALWRSKTKMPLCKEERKKIVKIYEECQHISKQTGIPHHVDHIIPISKGGLHISSNLQILTAEENLKKGNKTTPMPEHGG